MKNIAHSNIWHTLFSTNKFLRLTIFVAALTSMGGYVWMTSGIFQKGQERLCSNVYIDLGTNNGISIAEFINASAIEAHQEIRKVINYREQENLDVAGFCVYGFEPNPAHSQAHAAVTAKFRSQVRLLKIFSEVAAGPSDGWTSLKVDQYNGEFPSWGSSVMTDYKGQQNQNNVTVRVRTIRFLSFFESHVIKKLEPRGKVLMRVDVEGSEFVLLRDLISSGIACNYVDHLAIEWHDRWYGDSAGCIKSIMQWMLSNPKCKTGWDRVSAPASCDAWNLSDQFHVE